MEKNKNNMKKRKKEKEKKWKLIKTQSKDDIKKREMKNREMG